MTTIAPDRELICDDFEATFYLGTHNVAWLRTAPPDVALFLSYNRMKLLREWRKLELYPRRHYAIDSGAFTELQQHGKFQTSPQEYIDALIRADEQIGDIAWAAPQDWMCERPVREGGTWNGQHFAGTGLTVDDHLHLTVDNFVLLEQLWYERGGYGDCPVMPSVQGEKIADYERCVRYYLDAGVKLAEDYPVVGVGSVCRRQNTDEIGRIVRTLAQMDLPLHGFGVKIEGLARYGRWLTSADSMAWSKNYRHMPPVDGCMGLRGKGVKNCANCMHAALEWRDRVLAALRGGDVGDVEEQLELPLDGLLGTCT